MGDGEDRVNLQMDVEMPIRFELSAQGFVISKAFKDFMRAQGLEPPDRPGLIPDWVKDAWEKKQQE